MATQKGSRGVYGRKPNGQVSELKLNALGELDTDGSDGGNGGGGAAASPPFMATYKAVSTQPEYTTGNTVVEFVSVDAQTGLPVRTFYNKSTRLAFADRAGVADGLQMFLTERSIEQTPESLVEVKGAVYELLAKANLQLESLVATENYATWIFQIANENKTVVEVRLVAVLPGSGYAKGDRLVKIVRIGDSANIRSEYFYNETTGVALASPPDPLNLRPETDFVTGLSLNPGNLTQVAGQKAGAFSVTDALNEAVFSFDLPPGESFSVQTGGYKYLVVTFSEVGSNTNGSGFTGATGDVSSFPAIFLLRGGVVRRVLLGELIDKNETYVIPCNYKTIAFQTGSSGMATNYRGTARLTNAMQLQDVELGSIFERQVEAGKPRNWRNRYLCVVANPAFGLLVGDTLEYVAWLSPELNPDITPTVEYLMFNHRTRAVVNRTLSDSPTFFLALREVDAGFKRPSKNSFTGRYEVLLANTYRELFGVNLVRSGFEVFNNSASDVSLLIAPLTNIGAAITPGLGIIIKPGGSYSTNAGLVSQEPILFASAVAGGFISATDYSNPSI